MKIDFVKSVFVACLASLTGWGYYIMLEGDEQSKLPMGIVMGFEALVLGGGTLAINIPEYPRSTVMVHAACVTGLVILLIINAIYAFTEINNSFYIINGIVSLLTLLTSYCVGRSKQ